MFIISNFGATGVLKDKGQEEKMEGRNEARERRVNVD